MKLDKSHQSKNVEDRSKDTSAGAFKSNPHKNPALVRVDLQRRKEFQEFGKEKIKDTLDNKKSPFRKMLKNMDKPIPPLNPNDKTPIPTERPDPSKPYTKPTVFTNLKGYTSQVTPGDWKEKK
jgi:hypothetical protein